MYKYTTTSPVVNRERENQGYEDDTEYYEKNRVNLLRDERVYIQKKTYTKWCNSYLSKARLEIHDLFKDFGDGILFMKFLEIISGEKLPRPNRGRMRTQKIENLNYCLDFLRRKNIQLENIGAEDILDQNGRLILGLIWTIVLRFTIQNIDIREQTSGVRKNAKDALLLWCKNKTAGYPNVIVKNFTSSWASGLAFNALIHAHRPELINVDHLNPNDALSNLCNAFDVAENQLEIAQLLDAEDVAHHADEKSIITYVSLYYHYFAEQKTETTGARRVAKVVGNLMHHEQMEHDFEQISTDTLLWIRQTIRQLNDRRFPNSLREMQKQLVQFNNYRKTEKKLKYNEKGDLEALFGDIQTQRKSMSRSEYAPPKGFHIRDIESAWAKLDKAENERQLALMAEINRHENLKLKAKLFFRKTNSRDAWLREMINVLNDKYSEAPKDVEASVKLLQNISIQVGPKAEKFAALSALSNELKNKNYQDSDVVQELEREITERWNAFLTLLKQREGSLISLKNYGDLIRDIGALREKLQTLEPLMITRDTGKHILAVEEYLQKNDLNESTIKANGEWLKNVKKQSLEHIRNKGAHYDVLQRELDGVSRQYDNLVRFCIDRRLALQRAKEYFLFVQDYEEELDWLTEKHDFCLMLLNNRDLSNVSRISRNYKILETETAAHWKLSNQIISTGERLMPIAPSKEDVHLRIAKLQSRWDQFQKVSHSLSERLQEAEKACQYFQYATDVESWIKEKLPLACSDDYGRDLGTAESLLLRHARLEDEINAYKTDITQLDELATQLAKNRISFNQSPQVVGVTEEVIVPQVQAYDESNKECWKVLLKDGAEEHVPANYCQIVGNETVAVTQQSTKNYKNPQGEKNLILEKQTWIRESYSELKKQADIRRLSLIESKKLYAKLKCMEADTHSSPPIQLQSISIISSSNSFF